MKSVSKTTKIAVGAAILAIGGFSGVGLANAAQVSNTQQAEVTPATPAVPASPRSRRLLNFPPRRPSRLSPLFRLPRPLTARPRVTPASRTPKAPQRAPFPLTRTASPPRVQPTRRALPRPRPTPT
ncbi:hypothetical protein PJ267_11735 [Arthrobacter sp. OVS8]|nr:hypothetical protein PJ267_11735 [Arthrobacter sp. OVS8]